MTEEQLISGCIKKDRRSQNGLYEMYFPLMSSIALRYTSDEEEAIQRLNGGFFKILQNMHKYDNQFALATWIRNIMVNHLIDEFRKEQKYIANIHLTDFVDEDRAVDYNEGEQRLGEMELRALLDRLPNVTQKVFNLYAIDGYKHREIADYLGISEGTSKWHVSDARRRLKVMLEKRDQLENEIIELRK